MGERAVLWMNLKVRRTGARMVARVASDPHLLPTFEYDHFKFLITVEYLRTENY